MVTAGRLPNSCDGTTKTCIAVNDMTYEQLVDFLEHKMSMSHVYQPLLVRALVDVGGVATVRQLAHVFLAQDGIADPRGGVRGVIPEKRIY